MKSLFLISLFFIYLSPLSMTGQNCVLDGGISVTARSFPGPLEGPFFPGETVNFCLEINSYTSANNNCQWFQGIVPVFGDGWDPASSFEAGFGSPPVNATLNGQTFPAPGQSSGGTTWDWFSDVTYNNDWPFLNVGDFDGNGSIDLCSSIQEPDCSGSGLVGACCSPCWDSIPGTTLPPGWFAYGIQGECDSVGHPNVDYGDGICCNCSMGPWQFCFDLTVRDTPDCPNFGDLTVAFFTFTDGEIGSDSSSSPLICAMDSGYYYFAEGCCPVGTVTEIPDDSICANFPVFYDLYSYFDSSYTPFTWSAKPTTAIVGPVTGTTNIISHSLTTGDIKFFI